MLLNFILTLKTYLPEKRNLLSTVVNVLFHVPDIQCPCRLCFEGGKTYFCIHTHKHTHIYPQIHSIKPFKGNYLFNE